MSYALAKKGQQWRAAAAARMPEARGDIRQIVGQPVFVPLYKLFLAYGKVRSGAPQQRPPAGLPACGSDSQSAVSRRAAPPGCLPARWPR
jgi:hypothetical protein